jgi:hypothetical protein
MPHASGYRKMLMTALAPALGTSLPSHALSRTKTRTRPTPAVREGIDACDLHRRL